MRPTVDVIGISPYRLSRHLALLLTPSTGTTSYHVGKSRDFIHTTSSLAVDPEDISVIWDVVLLFAPGSLKERIDILDQQFNRDKANLFNLALTSTYFLFYGRFYEHKDGVAMG
jgi:hypothetical protein